VSEPAEGAAPARWRDVTLVHNPGSGDEAVALDGILALLDGAGYRVHDVPSDGPWEDALTEPADLVVALGGDGTIGQVLTWLVGHETPVGILPSGTANNIARTLGIRGDAETIIADWATAPIRSFDVWQVRDAARTVRFVEGFGGGFVGRLMERGRAAEKPSLILGGSLDRGRHLLSEAVAAEPPTDWRIVVDGVDRSGRYIGVEAMSIRSVGPNATFAPAADPGDGLIDLVLVDAERREPLLDGIAAMSTDMRADWPTLASIVGREVRLTPPSGVSLHVDDSPFEVRQGGAEGPTLTISWAGVVRYLARS
jgi:diacylglycerol kinase family enzyme